MSNMFDNVLLNLRYWRKLVWECVQLCESEAELQLPAPTGCDPVSICSGKENEELTSCWLPLLRLRPTIVFNISHRTQLHNQHTPPKKIWT